MIRWFILFFVYTIIYTSLQSQEVFIKGFVSDNTARIPGANVFLKGTYCGSSTILDGSFGFSCQLTDEMILIVSMVGFEKRELPLQIPNSSDTIHLDVLIREEVNKLNAVTISAGTLGGKAEQQSEVLKPLDIATTAGATADITGALNTLPGTSVAAEDGRLLVRGGEGREVKTFIDGLLVTDPYQVSAPGTPVRNRFSPFMFTGTSFSTGGYSSEFGDALSSVLNLKSRNEVSENRLDLGLMSLGGFITSSFRNDGFSSVNKIAYSNMEAYTLLANTKQDFIASPQSLEYSGFHTFRLKNHLFKAFMVKSGSKMSMNYEDFAIDSIYRVSITEDYQYINVSSSGIISERWSYDGGFATGSSVDTYTVEQGEKAVNQGTGHLKMQFYFEPNSRNEWKTGVELLSQSKLNHEHLLRDDLLSHWVEWQHYFTPSLVIRTGLRNAWSPEGEWMIDPRLSLAQEITEYSKWSLAYGKFTQGRFDETIGIGSSELYREKAHHYILNYQWVKSGRTLRTEIYHKDYQDLLISESNGNLKGEGYASGLDIFYRDNQTFDNTDFWVTYSFLDTERNTYYHPQWTTPQFAAKHKLSIVSKVFFESIRTQVGHSFTWSSPRTYFNPNIGESSSVGLSHFLDLSMNLSFLWKPWLIIHSSVSNLTGRQNILYRDFRQESNEAGIFEHRDVTLPMPRFFFLGAFITLSKDLKINQLPNL